MLESQGFEICLLHGDERYTLEPTNEQRREYLASIKSPWIGLPLTTTSTNPITPAAVADYILDGQPMARTKAIRPDVVNLILSYLQLSTSKYCTDVGSDTSDLDVNST